MNEAVTTSGTGDDDPDGARRRSGEVDGRTRVVARVQHVRVADSQQTVDVSDAALLRHRLTVRTVPPTDRSHAYECMLLNVSNQHIHFPKFIQRAAHRSYTKPGIERVKALADISRSALCCHSNETRAPIANPPNTAQLEGTPIIPPNFRVRAVVSECGEGQRDRQTDRHIHTQTAGTNIHFASATPHAKCNNKNSSGDEIANVNCFTTSHM